MRYLRMLKKAAAFAAVVSAVIIAATGISFADAPAEADQFGTVDLYSTSEAGRILKDSYKYSEQWFTADPEQENIGLALLSMQLVASAVDSDTDGLGGDFLTKLGFEDTGFWQNKNVDDLDCNYTYAIKTESDGTKLIAVAVQSYAFDMEGKKKGWPQNFTVNGDIAEGEHYALSKAAEAVLPKIIELSGSGNVKYWITGQSRGGAIANMLAAKLPVELEERNKGIYAYTFEAPAIAQPEDDGEREAFRDNYNYIHNYICSDDLVTMIPPWGMVRYGVDHQLDTDEANEGLETELKKLESTEKIPDGYNREEAKEFVEDIIEALESRISTRAEYSEDRTDTFTLKDGTEKVASYNYQTLLGKLLANIFGGVLEDLDTSKLTDEMTEALKIIEKYIRGYLAELGRIDGNPDPNVSYWEAATELNAFLKDTGDVDLGLSDDELFGLLKLAAPAIIDYKTVDESENPYDPNSDENMPVLMYVMSVMKLPSVMFSHHFDSLLARLHALSPAPEMSSLDLEVEAPEVSDPVAKMPRKISAKVSSLETASWLTASACWNTDDTTLKKNKHYYLDVTFSAAGHSIPGSLEIKINGEDPIEMTTGYKDGASTITATWKFTFGEPKTYKVVFDVNDVCEAPQKIDVEAGTMLKYFEKPEDPSAKGYRFDGWYDFEGIKWDDLTVTSDMRIYAKWIRQYDNVKVSFTIPRVGEKWKYPSVAAGSPYRIEEPELLDADYNSVTTVKNRKKMTISFTIRMNSGDSEFKTVPNEDDAYDYAGTVTVNGKKPSYIGIYEGTLRIQYEFTPKPKMPKLSKTSITVKKGKTKTVKIIGKDKSIKNVYKNTKKAKIKSKKTAAKIKVKGLKKGKTTLKIKANGVWLKLKVKVK